MVSSCFHAIASHKQTSPWAAVPNKRNLTNSSSTILLPLHKSSKSSSSSHPLRLLTTIFSSSLLSATAVSKSLSCASVTFCRSWPDCASVMSRFSISVARCSLTRRMRPRRSAASGWRIWLRICWRASSCCLVRSRGVSYRNFI